MTAFFSFYTHFSNTFVGKTSLSLAGFGSLQFAHLPSKVFPTCANQDLLLPFIYNLVLGPIPISTLTDLQTSRCIFAKSVRA